ncbi:MAG: MFS transporter [Desulfobacterales bacterium]|nr:MAG: MFS transporter [Desulfobacterales bacterium]
MKHGLSWSPANRILLLTWLLFGMYYVTRFNFSPVIPLLRADLGITNAQAGGLMAFFFVTYTAFQLPAGYLGDRLGPRKILTFGALVSIIGNLIFSQASSYLVLAFGQLVNGMGQAMGWSSSVKLIVSWFPKSRRGTAIGLFATCITGGSSLAIRLSGFLGDHLGWRYSFIIPSIMMAVVAVIFWIFVRNHPGEKGLPDFDDEILLEQQIESDSRSPLFMVLTNRTLWVIGLVYFFFVYVQFGCLVWIPTFLKESYTMSIDRASTIAFFILLPGVFASPLGGFLSDRLFGGRRKPLILLGLAVLAGSSFLLSLKLSIGFAAVVLAVVGLMILMPDVLLAAYPSDILSRKLSATAMGFLATFTSASGIITTPLSGKIADLFQSYGAVFFSFGVVALVGTVLTFFINEKMYFLSSAKSPAKPFGA